VNRLWLALSIYSGLAVIVLFVWQFPVFVLFENWVTLLIGLEHFKTQSLVWPMFWNLVVWFFSALQWHLNSYFMTLPQSKINKQ